MTRRRDLLEPLSSRTKTPFAWVLGELASLDPWTRPMFGCLAVYVGDQIVLILRDKASPIEDDGVWVATTREHHESLRRDLPSLRSITVLAMPATDRETGWQIVPAEADGFEEEVLCACALIRAGDPRIGKVPKAKKKRPAPTKPKATKATKAKSTKPTKKGATKRPSPRKPSKLRSPSRSRAR